MRKLMNFQTIKQILKGCLTRVPFLYRVMARKNHHAENARYCYTVWLRHLISLRESGMEESPDTVIELGPGGSIGTAIVAMLLGVNRYAALDVRDHTMESDYSGLLSELVDLIDSKSPIPGNEEFPDVKPSLQSYAFPEGISQSGDVNFHERIEHIKKLLLQLSNKSKEAKSGPLELNLVTNWNGKNKALLDRASADLVISQAVMEHVADISAVYDAINYWLRPGGLTSHQIDFKSHGTAEEWNGHWTYSRLVWSLIVGGRGYLINRHPFSSHVQALRNSGFSIIAEQIAIRESPIRLDQVDKDFPELTSSDLETSGGFVIAAKL